MTDISLIRTLRYHGHPATTETPLLRTPGYYGHPAVTDTPATTDIPRCRTFRYDGHSAITDKPPLKAVCYHRHAAVKDTSLLKPRQCNQLQWRLRYYEQPVITNTPLFYYGRLAIMTLRKSAITDTSLSRTRLAIMDTSLQTTSSYRHCAM